MCGRALLRMSIRRGYTSLADYSLLLFGRGRRGCSALRLRQPPV